MSKSSKRPDTYKSELYGYVDYFVFLKVINKSTIVRQQYCLKVPLKVS